MNDFPINVITCCQLGIGKQSYLIETFASRDTGANGYDITTYKKPRQRHASIQPIDVKTITLLGLNTNQIYIEIYDVQLIHVMDRKENPPRITFDGFYWTPLQPDEDYHAQGGWNSVICVRGKAAE